jgi:branched-chain amino acid transport system ATP-binding protein
VLELSGVDASYGPRRVLHEVSLSVAKGQVVTLLGANGAGKTTTLRTISGLVAPARGVVLLEGRPIHRLSAERIVGLGIAQVPEGRQVFPALTVRENLRMGGYTRRGGVALERDLGQVFEYFPILRERQRQLGGTLSGGEQQMLAIARGLLARPKVLLLDEPSHGLAPLVVREIFRIIRAINEAGVTILLVEQDAGIALSVAHRGYVMETGRLVLEGAAATLRANDAVRRSYLGV